MKNNKLRVIIFDDNQNVRESVKLLLSTTETMEIVESFENYENLLKDIAATKPDVVIMDIDMPGTNGIEGVTKLRVKYPELPVLMLTGFEDDEKVFNSICAGANGYVLKNASMDSLITQIEEVHQGGAPMTPVIARKVLNKFSKIHPPSKPVTEDDNLQLSSREYDVLQLLVKGKSYKMIAAELNVSYETVHSHIKKLYQKLQVNSVGEAVSKTLTKNILGKIMMLIATIFIPG
ncbi:MAG: response regulator transcription factor [Bacteroidetes bacterium]|nr:response regulator transcription factor [Bacteroidota bacterium]